MASSVPLSIFIDQCRTQVDDALSAILPDQNNVSPSYWKLCDTVCLTEVKGSVQRLFMPPVMLLEEMSGRQIAQPVL